MATHNVKLTTDTSQSQSAMSGLKTSWINAAAGMAVVEKALSFVGGALDSVNQKLRAQGQFFSAVKNDMELASVQMAMIASDGMIKPMTLARGANILMRGDLKLTQEQFETVSKAAIELGRATGQDVNQVFDALAQAINSGATRSLAQYGIAIDEAGTKAEKKQMVLGRLTQQYGSLTIAVGDAAEAQDRAANQSELQMLQNAKTLDGVSQTWTKFKDFYTNEFLAGGLDYLLGTTMSRTNQMKDLVDRLSSQSHAAFMQQASDYSDLIGAGIALADARKESEYERFDAAATAAKKDIEHQQRMMDIYAKHGLHIQKNAEEYKKHEEKLNQLEQVRVANLAMREQYEARQSQVVNDRAKKYWEENEAKKKHLAALKDELEKNRMIERVQIQTGIYRKSQFEINDNIDRLTKQIAASEKEISVETKNQAASVGLMEKSYENVLKFVTGIAKTIGAGAVWKETDEEKKKRLEREAAEKKRLQEKWAADALDKRAAEKQLRDQLDEDYKDYLNQKYVREEQEKRDAFSAEMKLGWDQENRREEQERSADERRTEYRRELREKQLEWLREDVDKETAIRKRAQDEDLARRKEYVAKTKELVEGLSQVAITAIFAEKKARDGLTRTEYMMKQLAAYMKGEALKYAAKSIGYLAEGIAASIWNPPVAAVAFKASAVSAAAATAFGGASMAAKSMAGSSSSSSSGSGSSGPQREAVGGTTAQRPNVTIVVGKEAFVIGTMDEMMRIINGGLQSAAKRGVL